MRTGHRARPVWHPDARERFGAPRKEPEFEGGLLTSDGPNKLHRRCDRGKGDGASPRAFVNWLERYCRDSFRGDARPCLLCCLFLALSPPFLWCLGAGFGPGASSARGRSGPTRLQTAATSCTCERGVRSSEHHSAQGRAAYRPVATIRGHWVHVRALAIATHWCARLGRACSDRDGARDLRGIGGACR